MNNEIEHLIVDDTESSVAVEKALVRFYKELARNQEALSPEFQKVINDNYWNLITGDNSG